MLWERYYSVYGRRKRTKAAREPRLASAVIKSPGLMRAGGIRGASRPLHAPHNPRQPLTPSPARAVRVVPGTSTELVGADRPGREARRSKLVQDRASAHTEGRSDPGQGES
jgi:hypothetical protein